MERRAQEDGILWLLEHQDFTGFADIPASWIGAPDPVFRYEQIVADPHLWFARIFEHCRLGVPESRRRAAVDRWMFENMAGRQRGRELLTSHMRKGIVGDWRNHFTPRIKEAFKQRCGGLLIRLGNEADNSW